MSGVHRLARQYRKSIRLGAHMHREAQLVFQLAADLGYASLSAFSHAFRQVTSKTPTEFVGMT